MKRKDISEKVLFDYDDIFSDIVNGLIFQGERRVLENSLENISTKSQYKTDDGKLHEQERDIQKIWKDEKLKITIWGIENQSIVEKYMPIRIIGYDGASYRSQLQKMNKKADGEIVPVVTIVLYFGTEKRWTAPKNLKALMIIFLI